jgi:hypothetical protein
MERWIPPMDGPGHTEGPAQWTMTCTAINLRQLIAASLPTGFLAAA